MNVLFALADAGLTTFDVSGPSFPHTALRALFGDAANAASVYEGSEQVLGTFKRRWGRGGGAGCRSGTAGYGSSGMGGQRAGGRCPVVLPARVARGGGWVWGRGSCKAEWGRVVREQHDSGEESVEEPALLCLAWSCLALGACVLSALVAHTDTH